MMDLIIVPMHVIGEGLAKFLNAYYGNIPILLAPIATILLAACGVIFVVGLLLLCKHRVRLFAIFALEPSKAVQ